MTSPDGVVAWIQWWDGLTGFPCHQLAARSPVHDGCVFAVCWRCSGIYLGVAASAFWTACRTRGPARPPSNVSAIICVLLMLPLIVDGWGQALGLWQTDASLRFATGWAMGISLPPLCFPLLARPVAAYRRSIDGRRDWFVLLSGGFFAWYLLRMPSGTMAILLRGAVNLGQLFLLIVIAGGVVLPLLRRRHLGV